MLFIIIEPGCMGKNFKLEIAIPAPKIESSNQHSFSPLNEANLKPNVETDTTKQPTFISCAICQKENEFNPTNDAHGPEY